MREILTTEAVGHVLCHDITQIVKGVTKDARFRKGHVVTEQDIPVLLSLGKEHLFVWERGEGMLHEDEAAVILYNICAGEHMRPSEIKEGKISVISEKNGLLTVDIEMLRRINSLGEMMIASRASLFPVKAGDYLAGTRIIPLVIEKEKMERAKRLAGQSKILALHPFKHKKAGIITIGEEVLSGRIKDTFTPVLVEKLEEYGAQVFENEVLGDDTEKITATIHRMLGDGCDLVLCAGGMSVDPDDRTPLAIKNTGAEIVSYGAPVLPGAMFLMAYLNGKAIMGLPGCVMYSKRTIFDLILPRVIADLPVTADDLAGLGHGGLCLNCEICTYPNCGFGKGV